MSILKWNRFVAFTLLLTTAVFIVPYTIQLIINEGGPFGFGLMLLPILIAFCFALIFAILGLIIKERNSTAFSAVLNLTIWVFGILIVASSFFMPLLWILIAVMFFIMWITFRESDEKVLNKLLSINISILFSEIVMIILFYSL